MPDEHVAYDCYNTLKDGVYQVSVTDAEEGKLGHIAFVLTNNFTIQTPQPSKTSLISTMSSSKSG